MTPYSSNVIEKLHLSSLNYFLYSFGYTHIRLIPKEQEDIDKCMNAMHLARLQYNYSYASFFKKK